MKLILFNGLIWLNWGVIDNCESVASRLVRVYEIQAWCCDKECKEFKHEITIDSALEWMRDYKIIQGRSDSDSDNRDESLCDWINPGRRIKKLCLYLKRQGDEVH